MTEVTRRKKPDDPKFTIQMAEKLLMHGHNNRVEISTLLLADLIALARAWVFTAHRPASEAHKEGRE